MNTIILFPVNPKESFSENSFSGKNIFSLTPGEIVWGRVIRVRDENQVLLQLNNHTLWARCSSPLPNKWSGYLQVKSIYSQVVLKVISETDEKKDIISTWLRIQGVPDLFSRNIFQSFFDLLETQVKDIPLPARMIGERILSSWKEFPSIILKDPELLSEFISQSGLFFESKLAQFLKNSSKVSRWYEGIDLKGDLLKLKDGLFSFLSSSKSDPKTLRNIETLLEEVDQLLQKIERFQILHFYMGHFQEKIFIPIPIWFYHHGKWGDLILFFSKSKEDKGGGKGLYIVFFLTLPDWERITIEIRIISKNLFGRIFVEQPEVLSFLQEDIGNLYSNLSNIGLKPKIQFLLEEGEQIASITRSLFSENLESLLNIII